MNENIKQKYPKLDAHGFLERAFFWINSGIDVGVFYAALELRFSFEKILIKHGFTSSNYTKSFEKMHWKPNQLHEALDKEFSHRIILAKAYKFFLETGNEPVIFGYYLPINQVLFSMYGKLDIYLHAHWAIPIGLPNDEWQKANSQILRDFAEKLIPNANPKNSLDYLSISNIKIDEMEISDIEIILKKYWQRWLWLTQKTVTQLHIHLIKVGLCLHLQVSAQTADSWTDIYQSYSFEICTQINNFQTLICLVANKYKRKGKCVA